MKSSIIVIISIYFFIGLSSAQSLTARNWLDYRGAKSGHSHFEDRAMLNINWGDFSTGLVYWARQPSRFDYAANSDTTFSEISQYWFSFYSEHVQLTAGSFTHTMGQGLLIDLYERIDLQIDHHCDGAIFAIDYKGFELSGFNAIAGWDNNSIVRGVSPAISIWNFKFGGEYAMILPELSAEQELWGAFASFDNDFLSLYGEYGEKNPLWGLEDEGSAIYASASFISEIVSITGEFKDYEEFAIRNTYAQYNNPPTLIMEPSYTLPGRHLRALDATDEVGFSADALGAIGPIGYEIFYAHAEMEDGNKPFDQIWSEIEYHNDDETFIGKCALDFQNDNDKNYITPIVDITYEPDLSLFAFGIIGEFQNTEEFSNVYGSFSVTYPSFATVGIEGGRIEDENTVWGFADLDIIERVKVRLGGGKRPGGFTCSGGVCRYEEAFEGIEAQLILTY